jgi:hypothetical protein
MEDLYNDINKKYDVKHPHPPYKNGSNIVPKQLQQKYHITRCPLIETNTGIHDYINGEWKTESNGLPILVTSPCLGTDSLGNMLGSYFEAISCAEQVGMHYAAVAKIYEPLTHDKPSTFLANLPSYIEHKNPIDISSDVGNKLKLICTCPGSCHERPFSAWIKGINNIKNILSYALEKELENNINAIDTVVASDDLSNVEAGTKLPVIPDASIHYRCGDNFGGHYGFVPFQTFSEKIPKDVNTIYVLAEKRSRKTLTKQHLARKCDAIFNRLYIYLTKSFPSAKILIRRGDDIYIDMARLAYAKTTVCSVSTFCLWPAIMSNGTAYFPKSKLIVGGNTNIKLSPNVVWFDKPEVVKGQQYASQISAETLLSRLTNHHSSRNTASRQSSVINTHDNGHGEKEMLRSEQYSIRNNNMRKNKKNVYV